MYDRKFFLKCIKAALGNEEMLERSAKTSFFNCHSKGLHSIAIIGVRGKMLCRFFIAAKDHDLYKNDGKELLNNPKIRGSALPPFSLGFHPHHCDLSITTLFGKITNCWLQYDDVLGLTNTSLIKYLYDSAILNKNRKGKFTKLHRVSVVSVFDVDVERGDSIHLSAEEFHTIYVEKGKEAIWGIKEGAKADFYRPYCITNDEVLDLASFEKFYIPMTLEECKEKLIYLLNTI